MATKDLFQWSDDFSVNIEEVDEQHKFLVSLLNELHVAIHEKHGSVASRQVLDRLAEYTRTHFMLEESLQRVSHYPGFEEHKKQHEELLSQVQALQKKLDEGNTSITFELLHFLKNWLIQHISDSDKRFGAYFTKANLGQHTALRKIVDNPKKKWWKFW